MVRTTWGAEGEIGGAMVNGPSPLQRAVIAAMPHMPRRVIAHAADRYVSGETLADCLRVAKDEANLGRHAIIGQVAEEAETIDQVLALRADYDAFLESGYPAKLTLIMTGLGYRLDPELCWRHLLEVTRAAHKRRIQVTISGEDSSTTSAMLDYYRRLRDEGLDNVGIVLIAAMRRALADTVSLKELKPRVRIVKGIWIEPFDVNYQSYDIIRANYLRILGELLASDSYVEIATHDDWLIEESLSLLRKYGYPRENYEFQLLLGVRNELSEMLVRDGHMVRTYIPYGADWQGYSIRRMRESPGFAKNAIADVTRRGLRRFGQILKLR